MANAIDFPGFVGPTYVSQSRNINAEECINLFVHVLDSQSSKSRMALFPTPGLDLFATAPISPNRGSFAQDGRAFALIGYGFFEVASDGTLTQHGTVAVDTNNGSIASSGDLGGELCIASAGSVYIFDLVTNTFSAAISGLTAHIVGYLDGYFLGLDIETSTLRISEYADGLTWDPLQFRTRSSSPDKWKSMVVSSNREIWLIGSESGEVWNNAGTFPFPFRPIPNVSFNQGTSTSFSLSPLANTVAWLSSNRDGQGMVMMADQYAPRRISNHAVEYAIQGYVRAGIDISDATSMSYQENGHTFFVLTFPSAETWVYDLTTGMWHKRGYWNVATAQYEAWRPGFHMYAFDRHLVSDRLTNKIYSMSSDNYLDVDDAYIRRLRRTPYLQTGNKQTRFHRLELEMQRGIGLASGQGSDPMVMLRYSNDGASTWGNEMHASAGRMGEYGIIVDWARLGMGRNRVFETSMSDPVPWQIAGAYIEATVGKH